MRNHFKEEFVYLGCLAGARACIADHRCILHTRICKRELFFSLPLGNQLRVHFEMCCAFFNPASRSCNRRSLGSTHRERTHFSAWSTPEGRMLPTRKSKQAWCVVQGQRGVIKLNPQLDLRSSLAALFFFFFSSLQKETRL